MPEVKTIIEFIDEGIGAIWVNARNIASVEILPRGHATCAIQIVVAAGAYLRTYTSTTQDSDAQDLTLQEILDAMDAANGMPHQNT